MNGRWRYLALMGTLLLFSCRTAPVSLSPTQIAERTKPATVIVLTKVEANGSIPTMALNTNRLETDASARMSAGDSNKQKTEIIFQTLLSSPAEYLREGDDSIPIKTEVEMMGTGFIVTPDGYILTNAHVVKPDKDYVIKSVVEKISDQVQHDLQDLKEKIERMLPGETLTDDAAQRLKSALMMQYARNASLDMNTDVSVVLAPHTEGDRAETRHCDIKKVGEPTPGKDVAVLKIEGHNLPTLPLAQGVESGSVTTGSDLVIMGYPGKLLEDPDFTDASKLQPSLTFGHVSGIREMAGGFRVIQTDATINHGNSGGPALNQFGLVVGQATFGETDSQGLNFAIDIGVAREYLQELNVNLPPPNKGPLPRPVPNPNPVPPPPVPPVRHSFPLALVLLLVLVIGGAVVVAIVVSRN